MSPDKQRSIESVFEHTQAGRWRQALEESRAVSILFPGDAHLRSLADDLAARCAVLPPDSGGPGTPAAVGASDAGGGETRDRALLDEAMRRRVQRPASAASMGDLVQDSRRISDVLREATTRHMDDDVDGLLTAARASLAQDLLPDAMRLCQKVLVLDPANEQVKGLLMEISRRKGL